ncbi:hypothetical protein T265_11400 [Opisthorchis viverrini]|uniref:Cell cycle control protein 50A n=1 Tax=Opisthorchis viverrini TaxID=6198 RepID=A0A074Z9N3_OPIVI|nr:hypothetical protein T265_11400 [Opisthorchis viverrini]KER19955.1 hypothetical protein T265_11400 [Opisthorchis viverrini]
MVPSRCSEEVRAPAFYQNYQSCPCTVSFTLDEAVHGQVYFFYGLSNFFQNHRRYIMSKDDAQLLGGTGPLSEACEPYRTNSRGVSYAPCGAIASSLFNAYPVTQFGGTKRFILSTESWLGGRNPTLGIAYIIVGSICLVLSILFLILHYRLPRRVRS